MIVDHPFTANEETKLFAKEIVCIHGFLASIALEIDHIFTSQFWMELFRISETDEVNLVLHIIHKWMPNRSCKPNFGGITL